MLIGFSLHGEHGKDNPNKPWSLSCRASDYRGLGEWHAYFLASNFLDHGCENIKPVFDFLKSGTDTVCKRHGLHRGNQTKSNDWCRYFIYLVSLNHNSLGLAPHAAVNLVSDTHAHFVLPEESTSWVIWEPMLVVKAIHSLINLTLHIITCNFVSHFPLGGRHCCAISLLSWWWSIYIYIEGPKQMT